MFFLQDRAVIYFLNTNQSYPHIPKTSSNKIIVNKDALCMSAIYFKNIIHPSELHK